MRRIVITALALALACVMVSSAQPTTSGVASVPPIATSHPGVSFSTGPRDPLAGAPGEAVCVIPSPEMAPDTLAELAEDLNIMCAVLDQLLWNANVQTESWAGRSNPYRRSVRSISLAHFGALFLVEVKFPLAALPEPQDQIEQEPADALWAEVRSNMRSQGLPDRRGPKEVAAKYDELKVESLKRTLLRGLRHAANIRHLGADEQIVLVALEAGDMTIPVGGDPYSASSAGDGPTRLLSLRAARKDIDAFAGGRTDEATFAQRVKTLSYELPPLRAAATDGPMR